MTVFIHTELYNRNDDAFIVRGNTFEAFGSTEEMLARALPEEEIIDLKGHYVVPGFVDSHMHLLEFGKYLSEEQLSGFADTGEITAYLKKRISAYGPGQWMIGRGYRGDLTKQMLDEISTDIPIVLTRVCGHVLTANSKALAEAGITEDMETEGGRVHFDTGVFEENALELIRSKIPAPDDAQIEAWLHKGAEYCAQHGITAVGSDDFISVTKDWHRILKCMENLSWKEELPVRIQEQCEFPSVKEFAKFLDEGYTYDVGNDFFRIGPLKLTCDGSLGGRTAALSKPYSDMPETSGYMTMSDEDIELHIELANRFNMPAICHAIGDETVEHILDIFDETVLPGNPLGHGLVHCQIMRPSQIKRVIEKKYTCYIQSQFISSDAPVLNARVGAKRAETSYPFKTLTEGTLTSNGSDAPVEMPDPLYGMRMAVTRTAPDGSAMNPDECMSVAQAMDTYISNGYKQLAMDDRCGKLEEGYPADFAVIDGNILKTEPEKLDSLSVTMTVLNGRTVFEK